MSAKSIAPCTDCGYEPCCCQDMLEAYYSLYPEDEPTACGMCSRVYTALVLTDGLCERCHRPEYDHGY